MSKSKNPETIALHGGEYRSDPATTAVEFQYTEPHPINLITLVMQQIYLP